MTFYPQGLLVFAAFVAVLLLAANARAGHIHTSLAIVGVAAIVAVEACLFLGLFTGRRRTR
jgi:hypothetical protein